MMVSREEYEKLTVLSIAYLRRAVEAEEKLRMIQSIINMEVFKVESLTNAIQEEETVD